MSDGTDDFDIDDPEAVLRQARKQFIDAFPERLQTIHSLVDTVEHDRAAAPADALRKMVHQMVGIGGTVGLPLVSERASDVEQVIIAWRGGTMPIGAPDARAALAELQTAFDADLAHPAPAWAAAPPQPSGAKILLVEDDPEQRAVVTSLLKQGGYQVAAVANGADAFDRAQLEQPALILLDVELPGVDGHALCRQFKASPEFGETPVMFMTTRASLMDRLTGQALGADDYPVKPVHARALRLRIGLQLERVKREPRPAPAAVATAPSPTLTTAPSPADTTVLLADDDPAIMRIVDAQLRGAGYRTELVFDGLAATAAITQRTPALVVLDLMMPKRTGFDVLGDLAALPRRPKVIVLSARGREEDVTRAFALGADDYMTKPFSPQELMARVVRLLR